MLISFALIMAALTVPIQAMSNAVLLGFGVSGFAFGLGKHASIRYRHVEVQSHIHPYGLYHGDEMVFVKNTATTVMNIVAIISFSFAIYKIDWRMVLA